jgi:hypothetical protein
MPKPEPIVTLRIDGRIIKADCPICGDPLGLGNEVSSLEEQERKMLEAFSRHVNQRHSGETCVNLRISHAAP